MQKLGWTAFYIDNFIGNKIFLVDILLIGFGLEFDKYWYGPEKVAYTSSILRQLYTLTVCVNIE